jgi:hypothetical protein
MQRRNSRFFAVLPPERAGFHRLCSKGEQGSEPIVTDLFVSGRHEHNIGFLVVIPLDVDVARNEWA